MPAERIILAIDAGGTSTRCVVASNRGTLLGVGRGGPGNHILAGWETARASLTDAASAALRSAGTIDLDVTVIGSSGVGADGLGAVIVERLLEETPTKAAQTVVTGDMVTALWGALHPPVGVVVCAGTGSVCFGRNALGRTCQVGGWGHIMGDEGSAYDIATRGLRAMAQAVDGRAALTSLTGLLSAAIGERSAVDAAVRLYSEPFTREQIAALAVHVVTAAQSGDATARDILRTAGTELGVAAVTALRTLDLIEIPAAVSFSGAVFEAGEPVLGALRAALNAAAPRVQLQAPLLPPVGGAFCLGMEALQSSVDDQVLAALRDGLNGSGL